MVFLRSNYSRRPMFSMLKLPVSHETPITNSQEDFRIGYIVIYHHCVAGPLVCPNKHDSELTYFSCYCTISPKSLHPKCVRATCLLNQKTMTRVFGKCSVLQVHQKRFELQISQKIALESYSPAPFSVIISCSYEQGFPPIASL